MKKFAGHRSYDEIKALCQEQGLRFVDTAYIFNGADSVTVVGGGAVVVYDTTTGRFRGSTPDGIDFDSNSDEHDNEPWFQALLSFFLIEKETP
jgi:hypothetical protein